MPYYEYVCKNCRVIKPVMHHMDETFMGTCDYCKQTDFDQYIFPPAIQFKGSGFYETDYKQKENK